jgi:exopolysaccharide biosynthesis protein
MRRYQKLIIACLAVLAAIGIYWYHRPHSVPPAPFTIQRPYSGFLYRELIKSNPDQRVYIMRVALNHPEIHIRVVPAGPDPDGDGKWQTTLQTVSSVARRENFAVAVNGDFFAAKNTVDIEGIHSGFTPGKWATVRGPAVTDGRIWATHKGPRAALWVDAENKVHIGELSEVPPGTKQAIGGSCLILKNGMIPPENGDDPLVHPRTVIGLRDNGKILVIVVVDGRHPGRTGMRLTEIATQMWQLKCTDAINLDGGGSSEMVCRNPQSGEYQIVNWPSDDRERGVANVLGVEITEKK